MDKRWLKDNALKDHRCVGMTKLLQYDEQKRLQRLRKIKSTIAGSRKHNGYIDKKYANRAKELRRDRKKREKMMRLHDDPHEGGIQVFVGSSDLVTNAGLKAHVQRNLLPQEKKSQKHKRNRKKRNESDKETKKGYKMVSEYGKYLENQIESNEGFDKSALYKERRRQLSMRLKCTVHDHKLEYEKHEVNMDEMNKENNLHSDADVEVERHNDWDDDSYGQDSFESDEDEYVENESI